MTLGNRRFLTNWRGDAFALTALRIMKFQWLGPNSARIEFFDGLTQRMDIHDAPRKSLELLEESMTAQIPDVSAHELETTKF